MAQDRIVSIVNPEAWHAHKSRAALKDGYKAHIVAEPETGIYASAAITKACGIESTDTYVGRVLLTTDPYMNGLDTVGNSNSAGDEGEEEFQVLDDSAYCSGGMLEHLETAGHQAVVKPKPLRPAGPGVYDLDDFAYDPQIVQHSPRSREATGLPGLTVDAPRHNRRKAPPSLHFVLHVPAAQFPHGRTSYQRNH